MNKVKISKFLGVGLALMLVLSMALALVPTKALAAPAQWTPENIPAAANGTNVIATVDVAGMAVASDGVTIYVINNQTASSILKSTNGGRTFAAVTNPSVSALRLIAIAPDNPNVVAIVDSTAAAAGVALGAVYVTRDGGVTWTLLPRVTGAALVRVLCIAVSPQRTLSVLLDGRDIAAGTGFDTTLLETTADMYIIGPTLGWVRIGGPVAASLDFTSITFSPGWVGDRVIIAVGSNGDAAGGLVVGTYLVMVNQQTGLYVNPPGAAVLIQATPLDFDIVGAVGIISSSIALPSGFDPTIPTSQRTFVGMSGAAAGDNTDAFRIDFTTVRKLGIATDVDINSIAYAGDLTGGVLLAGSRDGIAPSFATVWYTKDPMVAFPTWAGSAKPPTAGVGAGVALTTLRVTADGSKVYAGTCDAATPGDESALSVSIDSGKSFNQISLIDTAIAAIADVQVTPDGTTLFMITTSATGYGFESLWKGPVPTTLATWDRVRTSPADFGATAGTSIIRLNPDYADPVLFWGDVGATNIQYSGDGGATFVARNTIAANIVDIAVESKTVVYAAAATTVYRSDSAAWNFNVGPVNAGIGNINMIAMAPTYPLKPVAGNLLVGGAGAAVSWSTNSAVSFSPPAGTGLGASTLLQVVADSNYATNNTIYAASGTVGAAASIYRWVIGTSTLWTPTTTLTDVDPAAAVAPAAVTGMVATNGALYAAWDTNAVGAVLSGAERSLDPTDAVGILEWFRMDTGSAAARFTAVPQSLKIDATAFPTLYAIGVAGALWSYFDGLATVSTTLTVPATVPVDPVNGRAAPVVVNWTAMGVSTGLVTNYQVNVFEKAAGPTQSQAFFIALAGPAIAAPNATIAVAGGTIAYTFRASTEYGIMIRAWNEVSADQIVSPFCAPVYIAVGAGGVEVEMNPPLVVPPITLPPAPPANVISPAWIWAVVIIGAILVIAVIALIFTTRKTT